MNTLPQNVTMSYSEIISIISLAIAALSLLTSIITTYINRKYQFNETIYKTIFENAYRDYSDRVQLVRELAEKNQQTATLYGFDHYMISYHKLIGLFLNKKKLSADDIRRFYKEREELLGALRSEQISSKAQKRDTVEEKKPEEPQWL